MEDSPIYTTPPRHKWATEEAQADNRMLGAAVASLIARIEKAEARVKELEAAATETAHELTYERQMRQQADEARDKLVRRVKEQQDELGEQEVDKLTLLRELREGRAALHNATR